MDSRSLVRFVSKGLALLVLSLGASLQALPMGNPMEASLYTQTSFGLPESLNFISLRMGFYGDHVYNRKLELRNTNDNADVDRTKIDTSAGMVVVNLCRVVEAFGTFGATKFEIKTPAKTFSSSPFFSLFNAPLTLETESSWSWSAGGRVTLVDILGVTTGVEGAYFRTKPDVTSIRLFDFSTLYPEDFSIEYKEWQVGGGFAYPFTCGSCALHLVPYAGVKASWVRMNMDQRIDIDADTSLLFNDLENKFCLGYPFGVSLTLCESIGVTVEGRLGDEQAIHVNGEFRF